MRQLVLGTVFVATLAAWPSAQTPQENVRLEAVSARPEFVSGGDVLVRVRMPVGLASNAATVSLNGTDVTSAFKPDAATQSLLGLVAGLKAGANSLEVTAGSARGRLAVVNHPITGPMISGPQEQPFICQTEQFKLQSGATLGKALDANCSVATRVDYYYRPASGGALMPMPPSGTPADVGTATTLAGAKVPYIVRIETGTINRGIYQIAMLHDPASGQMPSPWTKSAGWNDRLVYTHGGGCTSGWYRQGANTGGVVDDFMLRQGYAVASSSLNVFGNNCSDLHTSETMMMVKERFIEAYGAPAFTIGWGCSGGSYQQLQTADNYPGLLDGIIPCRTFPDVSFATIPVITDARLLNTYFKKATVPYTEEQQRTVTGFLQLATMKAVDEDGAGRIHVTEFCPDVLPMEQRYDAVKNPKGARCDVYDHAANAYGRDPKTGYALRPLDNVGIQYGLRALNDGAITKEQFLDLNAHVGGFDHDGNVVSTRSVADPAAIRASYRTGRMTWGGAGLAQVPIIDYRNYMDDAKDGDVHVRFHSFSLRERLKKANGHVDNHVMWVEDNRYRGNSSSPNYQDALAQMDRWLTGITKDASADPIMSKIRRHKPAELADACWTRDAQQKKILEPATRDTKSQCTQMFPTASFPREVAGAGVAGDVIKCQLKPVQASDYAVTFTPDEMARLTSTFPAGVCDWSKPGVDQQKLAGTWQKVGSGT